MCVPTLSKILRPVTRNTLISYLALAVTCPRTQNYSDNNLIVDFSDSFTILGLWVLGLAVSNINESRLQTYESKTLFLMTKIVSEYDQEIPQSQTADNPVAPRGRAAVIRSLQYYCIPGLAKIKTYAQKMQDAQVTKSLTVWILISWHHH